jgi:hypothetical protein
MYYVFSCAGYEDYEPTWFECDCTKEQFEKSVYKAIDKACNNALRDDKDYVCEYSVYGEVVELLKKQGYKHVIQDYEIVMDNMFTSGDQKPVYLTDKTWNKIVKEKLKYEENLHKEYEIREAGETKSKHEKDINVK